MNRSNWEHVLYALLAQAIVGLVTGSLWIGAALSIGFFAGREHAQREYQITEGYPVGGLKPWEGFRGWGSDLRNDFYPAAIAVVLVAGFGEFLR